MLDYPKLEDIFEELNITSLFDSLNQNLREIKDGILNLITGNGLSEEQSKFICHEKREIDNEALKLQEVNNFILFKDFGCVSSTARKSLVICHKIALIIKKFSEIGPHFLQNPCTQFLK